MEQNRLEETLKNWISFWIVAEYLLLMVLGGCMASMLWGISGLLNVPSKIVFLTGLASLIVCLLLIVSAEAKNWNISQIKKLRL